MQLDAMWRRISVELGFKTRVIGGVPANREMIEIWIRSKMKAQTSEEEIQKLVTKTLEELPQLADEKAEAENKWNTFKRDKDGICLESRQVKAMFKESANILRDMLTKMDQKVQKAAVKAAKEAGDESAKEGKSKFTNLKSKLAERLFVEGDYVFLMRDGKRVLNPDGRDERPINVMTAMGPRTSIKRTDYVDPPCTARFDVRYLNDGLVDVDLIRALLEHSAYNGLGADRSQGNGQFEVLDIKPI